MNAHLPRTLLALFSLFLAGQASAIPVLNSVGFAFGQSGQNALAVAVVVDAETTASLLSVGGGFTVICDSSPSLPIMDQLQDTKSNFLGVRIILQVPLVIPKIYPVPGWSNIPAASCGQCLMHYKGEARDETNTQFHIGFQGTGVTFSLIPTGQVNLTSTAFASVCKGGRPQCCTPGCQLP